jgi:subtilisin family serine protease
VPRRPSSRERRRLALATLPLLIAAGVVGATWSLASAHGQEAGESGVAAGRFIITVAPGESPKAIATESRRRGAEIDFVYSNAVRGFAGRMADAEVAQLRADRRIVRIEADQRVEASTAAVTQLSPPWGLDRIDQRLRPLNGAYQASTTAAGLTAYVIDTGIYAAHQDFGGRVAAGYTAISDGRMTDDCNGHGTHVAGTMGGATYGAAKAVTLIPVRVLNCQGSGTWSGVIAGLDWVATHHTTARAVANMSLGGGKSDTVNAAVRRVVNDGVVVAVAAGNSGADACRYSPASELSALTVGATTSADARASFSNWGKCLDLFAPGVGITSAWIGSTTKTHTISGTSMAAPHVAGAAALRLVTEPNPRTVENALIAASTSGRVTSAGKGSPNRLLYTGP